jgi:transposase
LSDGQTHDVTQAEDTHAGAATEAVVSNKAYNSAALIVVSTQAGARVVIPPCENRQEPRAFDRHHYIHRNLIERFFCRLKRFRRIATGYNTVASRSSAFIAIGETFISLS